jgi:hypothetical protein
LSDGVNHGVESIVARIASVVARHTTGEVSVGTNHCDAAQLASVEGEGASSVLDEGGTLREEREREREKRERERERREREESHVKQHVGLYISMKDGHSPTRTAPCRTNQCTQQLCTQQRL